MRCTMKIYTGETPNLQIRPFTERSLQYIFSLTLSDINMQLVSDSVGESLVGTATLFQYNVTSITIPKSSNMDVSIAYIFNTTAQVIAQVNRACFTTAGITYITSGTVNMATWYHDFGSQSLGKFIFLSSSFAFMN